MSRCGEREWLRIKRAERAERAERVERWRRKIRWDH
jgi:hypothetical protein